MNHDFFDLLNGISEKKSKNCNCCGEKETKNQYAITLRYTEGSEESPKVYVEDGRGSSETIAVMLCAAAQMISEESGLEKSRVATGFMKSILSTTVGQLFDEVLA